MHENCTVNDCGVDLVTFPVLDYESLNSHTAEVRKKALTDLDAALQDVGIVHICNHTISQDKINLAFDWSAKFFSLPLATKALIANPGSGALEELLGWSKNESSQEVRPILDSQAEVGRKSNPDHKETLELGNPKSTNIPCNPWLPEQNLPGFRQFVESWWDDCAALAHSLFKPLGEALGVHEEDCFNRLHTNHDVCHLTWNFYPSMASKTLCLPETNRLGAHTDFGTVTLVFQDTVGGLEVHDGTRYRPIVPVPGAVLVIVGDTLEQQSNGRWKSALHRVVAPTYPLRHGSDQDIDDNYKVRDRYSLVWFGAPNPSEIVEPLPGCERSGRWKPIMSEFSTPVTTREWIESRLRLGL